MIIKIEPSGCEERKEMVKVRVDFYVESHEVGYDKTHYLWQVEPDHPEYIPYDGKLNKAGTPEDIGHWTIWWESLPKEWKHAPFHSHRFYVESNATDDEILKEAEKFCKEAYKSWKANGKIDIKNIKRNWPEKENQQKIDACNSRVEQLTAIEKRITE